MIRLVTSRALWMGVLSGIAAGCMGAAIDPPAVPLSVSEQRAVVACQSTINDQVAGLTESASEQLDRCGIRALSLRLEEERVGINSSNIGEYIAKRERLRNQCQESYERIGRATTRMIDRIIGRCEPVEDLILFAPTRGNPLAWKGGVEYENGPISPTVPGPQSVAELAGSMCGLAIASTQLNVAFGFPRTGDLIRRYYGFADDEEFQDHWRAALDPRCSGGVSF